MIARGQDELSKELKETKRLQLLIMHNFAGQMKAVKEETKLVNAKYEAQAVTLRDLKKVQAAHTVQLASQGGGVTTAACMISPAIARARPRLVAASLVAAKANSAYYTYCTDYTRRDQLLHTY